ncbi:MAG: alcohol dehydrogenase catalytic domain-containing protein, partial [Acidobacteriota bacterium]
MRALVCPEYGSLSNLRVDDIETPEPGDGEVLIDVHAAGLNFPDLLMVRGLYQAKPELPFVPGGEAAGVVRAVGPGVKRLKAGDAVIGMSLTGAFAESWVVPEKACMPKPGGLPFDAAAGLAITYGTSYYALKQ